MPAVQTDKDDTGWRCCVLKMYFNRRTPEHDNQITWRITPINANKLCVYTRKRNYNDSDTIRYV